MKIFVSSTYVDLKNHRKAIDEILNRMCHEFRGMEYFGSRKFEPKKVCFSEIEQCQLFIGIYAHRYGFVPKGENKSITELEFDKARAQGLDCFCYVVNKDFEWMPKHIEYAAESKISKFKQKIDQLVRSEFTSPDNLAKQVAADLARRLDEVSYDLNYDSVKKQLRMLCKKEISSRIGRKYIKEIYVGRSLERTLNKNIKDRRFIPRLIASIEADCIELYELLESIPTPGLALNRKKMISKLSKDLQSTFKNIRQFKSLKIYNPYLCFPATKLMNVINKIQNSVQSADTRIVRNVIKELWRGEYYNETSELIERIDESSFLLNKAICPIHLIIDRAGGGKTNLLCRLTEELGKEYITFFLSAKSIPYADIDSIRSYFASAYRFAIDPIEEALCLAESENTCVIIIVDGINEHLEPERFNIAMQDFVQHYYGRPIKYLISCRDIYWKYFAGEFWNAHCNSISKDELYSFNAREFSKVLPKYFKQYKINAEPEGQAKSQLAHPLLLRFYCEAFGSGNEEEIVYLGKVEDIRLLELFNTYCDRKFEQIRVRMHLISSSEIFDYLSMIALMMLRKSSRFLPEKSVARKALRLFGEQTIRTKESRYVQVLDEDILLEERPEGPLMSIKVGFVYDEFMEYVIASALWVQLKEKYSSIGLNEVKVLSSQLFKKEKKFISVFGIVVYLGELLTNSSIDQGLAYLKWLVQTERYQLACDLIVRWPLSADNNKHFKMLIELHDPSQDSIVRRLAWKAMLKICHRYWDIFFDYLSELPLKGQYRPVYTFSAIRKVGGGILPENRLETVKWIAQVIVSQKYMIADRNCNDYKAGLKTINKIIETSSDDWSEKQLLLAKNCILEVKKTVDNFKFI